MSQGGSNLFIDTGVALAWAGPSASIAMLGGYISATKVKIKDSAKEACLLQGYLIYRPLLLLLFLISSFYLMGNNSSFAYLFLSFLSFLVLTSITDAFLFYKGILLFIFLNFCLSLFVSFSSYLVFFNIANITKLTFVWVTAIVVLTIFLAFSNIVSLGGGKYFLKNLSFFLIKNILPSFLIVMSSISLGIFLVFDRLFLPYFMGKSDLVHYLAAVTMALPISLLAVVRGKYTLLKNFYSRFDEVKNSQIGLIEVFSVFCLGLLFLPLQFLVIRYFSSYEFDVFLQLSINLAVCLIVLSKPPLAKIYAENQQKIVTIINLILICLMPVALIYFSSNVIAEGFIRLCFNIIYFVIIVSVFVKLKGSVVNS